MENHTRSEITGNRDLSFSGWIRKKLPDSHNGFMVTDIDFYLEDYNLKKAIIVEVKQHSNDIKSWQSKIYNRLERWIKNGIDSDWTFLGCFLIQFSHTDFTDGNCKLNGELVTEQELIDILSFKLLINESGKWE